MQLAGVAANPVLIGIGAEVKKRRQALGLTQAKLAKKARVHANVIGRLERGTYNPTVIVLNWIAAALRSSLPELLAQTQPSRRAKAG